MHRFFSETRCSDNGALIGSYTYSHTPYWTV